MRGCGRNLQQRTGSRARWPGSIWRWITDHEPLRVVYLVPYLIVGEILFYAIAFVLVDVLLTDIPLWIGGSWFGADPAYEIRKNDLDALLAVTGVPTLLLLALATLAVPSLSPAISSSLPLLFLRYSRIRLPVAVERVLGLATVLVLGWWVVQPGRDDTRVSSAWIALVVLVVFVIYTSVRMRTNLLHRSIVLAGSLTGGIGLLDGIVDLQPHWRVDLGYIGPLHLVGSLAVNREQQEHMLTILLAAGLEVVEAALLLALVLWLLRLRQPGELIQHLQQMADNVIHHVHRTSQLKRSREPLLSDEVTCLYEEQEELRQAVQALEQIGLHFLTENQPTFSRYAVTALHSIHRQARRLDGRTSDWLVLRSFKRAPRGSEPLAWVDLICMQSIAAILYLCAEEHYLSVGEPAATRLLEMALTGLLNEKAPLGPEGLRAQLVLEVLRCFANAYDECVEYGEQLLGDRVLSSMAALMAKLAEVDALLPTQGWSKALTAKATRREDTSLESMLIDCARLAAKNNEISALRSFLEAIRPWRSSAAYRDAFSAMGVDAGATALAARAYGTASVLIDWVERLDPKGEFFVKAAGQYIKDEAVDRTDSRPLEATHRYMRVFLALATTRIMSGVGRRWTAECCQEARAVVRGDSDDQVADAAGRCLTVLRRLVREVAYDDAERVERWATVTAMWLA